ncbi:MAG: hypothetical protein RMH97_10760 [Verrucomicrobiales bacterium]|nr:hypothetical protein [Verrucomicrobiales bacterium]
MKTQKAVRTGQTQAWRVFAAAIALMYALYPRANAQFTIECGQTVVGTIAVPGESDIYYFTGTAGQVIIVTATSPDTNLCARAEVRAPGGTFLGSNVCDRATAPITLPVTGVYSITVRDRNNQYTGLYGLNLASVTGACGEWLGCNQSITNSLLIPGETDIYRFNGEAGQAVVLSTYSSDPNLCVRIEVYSPTGQLLGTNLCDKPTGVIVLPTNGTYTVLVHDRTYENTGAYGLGLSFVTGQCGTQIACGQTVTGTIDFEGETDTYTFSGNAGEVVVVSAFGTYSPNLPYLCAAVEVHDPAGNLIGSMNCNGATTNIVLPTTGTYTIRVHDGNYQDTGPYGLSLSFVTGRCGMQIGCGQTITNSIDIPGETDTYVFHGAAGEIALVTIYGTYSSTSAYLCAAADVHAPNGNWIGGMYCNGTSTNLVLPATGIYTIRVHDGNYQDTGPYGLSLVMLGGRCGTPLVCAQTITNSITMRAETHAYTFQGFAGQSIRVGATAPDPDLCMRVRVYSSSGQLLATNVCDLQTAVFALPTTGNHTILVHDSNYQDTGAYTVSLSCFGPFPTLTISASNSVPVLTYWGLPGTRNAIEYTTNLADGSTQWLTLWSNVLSVSPYLVPDWTWTNSPQRFYRAVQLP